MSTRMIHTLAWALLALSISAPAAAWNCQFPPEANSCPGPQVVDVSDDAIAGGAAPNLDVLSAAFTAGGVEITLRIKDLSTPPPPATPGGQWAVCFDFGGQRYIVEAHGTVDPATVVYTAGRFSAPGDGCDGEIDTELPPAPVPGSFNPGPDGTIVFRVPLSAIGNPVAGAVLTDISAATYQVITVSSAAQGTIVFARGPIVDRAPDSGYGADYTVGKVCIP